MKYNWREGNSVELCINGEEFFPHLFKTIDHATEEIIIETFILSEDNVGHQLQKHLIDAAKRGVRINLTVDDYGTWDLSTEFVKAMTDAGVMLHIFDPQPKLWGVRLNLFRRLHRKIVVVDKKIAFIGGINYSDDHMMDFGEKAKQDYAVQLQGPIVADIHKSCMLLLLRGSNHKNRKAYFNNDPLPSPHPIGNIPALFIERDNNGHKKDIEQQHLLAIRTAKKRVVIANAYFFPRYFFLLTLRRAARRGVSVTLILQGQPDMPWVTSLSRLLYGYLLRSNVKIYEYCQRSLHGKIALIDDQWVTIGSSNLDPLSCSLNLEANVILQDPELNRTLYDHLKNLVKNHCQKVNMEFAKRGYWWRVPLIFLSFHFLRHFPSMVGWLPAHAPVLKMIHPQKRLWWGKSIKDEKLETGSKSRTDTYNKESIS